MECLEDESCGRRLHMTFTRCCSCESLKKRLPFLQWLPRYSLQWLQLDLIAGLTVGLTVVPQALAYAEVAGLPVQFGLYSSFVGCFIYCFLGTSKDVTLGPTAIMSLLVFVYTLGDLSLAILLAFLSGCIQLAMGLLNFGFLLDFISYPVIKAFTSAAAVTIAFSQVKNLLGLQNIPRQFILQVYQTFRELPSTRPGDAILGILCIAILLALKWMKDHTSRPYRSMSICHRICYLIVWIMTTARNALVVVGAGLVAYSFHVMGSQPFILTGKTAKGLPQFQLPPFSEITPNGTRTFSEMVQVIGSGLLIIPLMGLLESVAIARAFGFTNILGSFLSSYPVTGSFGRTALNSQTGVCTPAGGVITELDLIPFFVTFLLSFWEIQYGILAGAFVSIIILCYPIARPEIKVSDMDGLVLTPMSGLSFPVMEFLKDKIYEKTLTVSPPRSVTLDFTHVNVIDYTVAVGMADLLSEFKAQGVCLSFSALQPHLLRMLSSSDLLGLQNLHSLKTADPVFAQDSEDESTQPLLHNGIVSLP
ncbi:sodium-independent sulfate anion transporter isoform X4 [Xenopus laevis]|uniref:Sodium-independent sulfate anion transporter isoform X4 n=1 Tax=Xenopus laevis TaxID=8355 RepID=A0A8J1LTU8_XENLA|nr:sodium-independent sulfate anion transporter isoform X4 [Xenopus laevis]